MGWTDRVLQVAPIPERRKKHKLELKRESEKGQQETFSRLSQNRTFERSKIKSNVAQRHCEPLHIHRPPPLQTCANCRSHRPRSNDDV